MTTTSTYTVQVTHRDERHQQTGLDPTQAAQLAQAIAEQFQHYRVDIVNEQTDAIRTVIPR